MGVQDREIVEVEQELISRIGDLSVIVDGLEHHAPFLKLIETFQRTVKSIDSVWHMTIDPQKLNELRITKFAADEIINYISIAKQERQKLQMELAKLENPDLIINKDYDTD